MRSMVVLFALSSVACGSLLPLAQPPYHPALVLDPRGRPLDTAAVIGARALHLQAKALEHHAPLAHAVAHLAHSVVSRACSTGTGFHTKSPDFPGFPGKLHGLVVSPGVVAHSLPAAVSHQSRVDVHSSPAIVAHAPVITAHAAPLLGYSAHGLAAHGHAVACVALSRVTGHGHLLKKRSLGHLALAAPIIAHAPAATSHQSRVDVISSPAVVFHAVHASPVLAHAVHAAPDVSHAIAPSAVSHQSRVDIHSSPAVVAHSVLTAPVHSVAVAPLHGAHSLIGGHSLISAHSGLAHGHLLKKRSLLSAWAPIAHTIPSAVSHQSRVDVISSPAVVARAAPIAVAHAAPVVAHVAPSAVSQQSRVDVISSPAHSAHVAPLAHSAVWTAPLSHLSHHGLLHSAHAAHW